MSDEQPKTFGERTGRRPFIVGMGMAMGTIVIPTGTGVVAGQGQATELVVPPWWAMWGDTDEDGSFQTVMHRETPTDRFCDTDTGRENVIHVTSEGAMTRDYAVSLINLEDIGISLGGANSGTRITYDFLEGPDNTGPAPDDLFVLLRTENDADDQVTVAFQPHDAADLGDVTCDTLADHWQTHSVSNRLDGTGAPWRAIQVNQDTVTDGEALRNAAIELRSAESFNSLIDRFGEQPDFLAVGIGVGATVTGQTIDLYFDQLSIGDELTRGFSATVPMDLSLDQQGDGAVHFTATFTQSENGLGLDSLNLASVRLAPYSPGAPPIDTGAMVGGVRIEDDELRGVFPASAVNDVLDEGAQTVFVTGEFDVEPTARFVGVGGLEPSS